MRLEDFPTDLPRIPHNKSSRWIFGNMAEFAEILPVINARFMEHENGELAHRIHRQNSLHRDKPQYILVYTYGLYEVIEDGKIKDCLIAYSDGRNKSTLESDTVILMNIDQLESYRTIEKEV
jgi:hypothetical protein